MVRKRVVTIEMEEHEWRALRSFSHLPAWVRDEFSRQFGPCHLPSLPVEEVRKLTEQADGFKSCQCGHAVRRHSEAGMCKDCGCGPCETVLEGRR